MNHVVNKRVRHQVVVTLKSGTAFTGLLWESDRHALVLREAKVLEGERPVSADGEIVVLWANVDYLQKP